MTTTPITDTRLARLIAEAESSMRSFSRRGMHNAAALARDTWQALMQLQVLRDQAKEKSK